MGMANGMLLILLFFIFLSLNQVYIAKYAAHM
jgi:hypothetical protein